MSEKLSEAQFRMLSDLNEHGNLYYRVRGRSQHGGAIRAVFAMRRRGYLDEDWNITSAGEAALVRARTPPAIEQ